MKSQICRVAASEPYDRQWGTLAHTAKLTATAIAAAMIAVCVMCVCLAIGGIRRRKVLL